MHGFANNYTTLVLNADYRPLSYFPLSICPWQDTVRDVFLGRVEIVSEYNDKVIRSPSFQMNLPSVVALKQYVKTKELPCFTRFNVFLRDKWICQYCGKEFITHELTFDHVIPRSRGGVANWDNIVTCCQRCNTLKGNTLPEESRMFPIKSPRQPSNMELYKNGKSFPSNFLHESWNDYLYWDVELES